MLADLLPPDVVVAERFDDVPETELFPDERAVVARAVERRRREFATVRACAREALGRLGFDPTPILPGLRGAPVWPAGVVGSMTHCDGYRACAVGLRVRVIATGVDAEPHAPLPAGVLAAVALPEERTALAALAATRPDVHWDRLLFSAKESVYKTWYPLTGRPLDFDQAQLRFHPGTGTFDARLLVGGPGLARAGLGGFTGRWSVRDGLVLTAIAVAATEGRPVGARV
ncbi:4'-phosphopantetheinyl transferase superfamily protein [Micromonospora sp. WMMD1082]|uniref:4'-phosphopantetheinyl transferase family protein n=1 Tax=Micromonospora sp. WMMD1082 TaxID=3016104 RepID=UPI0024163149|nr:4'-phosphopantetheinyl transferase superfamily protein [Micromonospora sp. WMMD1082]MDG4794576.1 4'-phosphopantetheinyl transferase superfamily protein [Micromonospora sp. WMMD1082]